MTQPRLQATGSDSFFGDYLYERVVPQDHFLRRLRDVVPWRCFTYRLLKYYRGKGKIGRPPIDPALVLKMLLLSYLYDLSERQVEEFFQEEVDSLLADIAEKTGGGEGKEWEVNV